MSRSWTRICAPFGFERDGFGLMVRPWYRTRENWAVDEKPAITTYVGYGYIVATYERSGDMLSPLLRSSVNFWHFHGAVQAYWSFPL